MVFLRAVVHPVDVDAHPTVPPGFRWAVMVGQAPDGDLRACANAGWCPTRAEAEAEGDRNAATATRALHIFGISAGYSGVSYVDVDPIPAGADRINVA